MINSSFSVTIFDINQDFLNKYLNSQCFRANSYDRLKIPDLVPITFRRQNYSQDYFNLSWGLWNLIRPSDLKSGDEIGSRLATDFILNNKIGFQFCLNFQFLIEIVRFSIKLDCVRFNRFICMSKCSKIFQLFYQIWFKK